jgi:hypothetical protein
MSPFLWRENEGPVVVVSVEGDEALLPGFVELLGGEVDVAVVADVLVSDSLMSIIRTRLPSEMSYKTR